MLNFDQKTVTRITIVIVFFFSIITVKSKSANKVKYQILLWTSALKTPFDILETGNTVFTNRVCSHQNCYFTKNSSSITNVTDYHAIIFNAVNLNDTKENIFPKHRTQDQLYIFFSIEPPSLHPLTKDYKNAFNITWTYKLDSNITFPYFTVFNNSGRQIAPSVKINWKNKHMKSIQKYLKSKLRRKTVAAAWIASNCLAKNKRLEFVRNLQLELAKYNHSVDIFGRCGTMECKTYALDECYAAIETDYYFYLAFENSNHEDYVTEKVLHGLQHYTVPIVYGGADYNRFLPSNSYLNARELGVIRLAQTMDDIIQNRSKYYEFFKWHNYYEFHHTSENLYTEQICSLCAMVNNVSKNKVRSVFPDIVSWWNGENIDSSIMYGDSINEYEYTNDAS